MAISKAEFKGALREVISSEFKDIPTEENDIDFTFSNWFEKRMAKIIKMQKKSYWKLINTASKRAAIICLTVLALCASALSVKAIREPIVTFFSEIYDGFHAYFFKGDLTDEITREYRITRLPEGYVQTDKVSNDISVTAVYENGENEIQLTQAITSNTSLVLDNEHGSITTITVAGLQVDLYEGEQLKIALWTNDGYFFNLTCYGEIDVDAVKDMIESMQ